MVMRGSYGRVTECATAASMWIKRRYVQGNRIDCGRINPGISLATTVP